MLLRAAPLPAAIPPAAPQSLALAAIRAANRLDCAVVRGEEDWNGEDVHGDISAFAGEVCRAVALAVLGEHGTVAVHPYPGEDEAIAALTGGQVQLAVGLSPTTSAGVTHGIAFGRPVFFDTQRLLVNRSSGIRDAAGLKDQLICAMDLLPPEQTLRDEMTARGIPYALQSHSEQGEMDAAIAVRRCAAGTGMETRLAQSRSNFHARADDFVFLPERWGVNPIATATRMGDPMLSFVVDDTVSALIEAEALGITRANIGAAVKRTDQRAAQLLGHDFAIAQALGLRRDWAVTVISAVGNYGEVFTATLGRPYRLQRGLNALWTDGGLMAPTPMK